MYPGVKAVKPLADFHLLLTFDGGEKRVFDVSPWLDKGMFRELRDEALFRTVRVSFDTVEWGNGADLCPELLYEDSRPLEDSRSVRRAVVAESRAAHGKRRGSRE